VWTGIALAALVVSAFLAGASRGRGRVASGGLLAAVSVLWLLVDGPAEIGVLWFFDHDHGLTAGDLAGLAGLVLAAWCMVTGLRTPPRG
jgi:hypothetical protein